MWYLIADIWRRNIGKSCEIDNNLLHKMTGNTRALKRRLETGIEAVATVS